MASNFFDDDEPTLPSDTERIQHPVSNLYSVIISGVDHCINPNTFKPKVACKDERTGKPKKTRQGQLYTEYAKKTDFGEAGLVSKIVNDWTTPRDTLGELSGNCKKALNSLKKFVNSNQVAAFWHNGAKDNGCEYNDMHLHLVVGLVTGLDQLSQYKPWRTVRKTNDK